MDQNSGRQREWMENRRRRREEEDEGEEEEGKSDCSHESAVRLSVIIIMSRTAIV